jgi:hypothetical protein
MAIAYKIFRNERLIRVSATGIVHSKDMDDFVDALLADPALEPRLRLLYDARYSEPDIPILQLAEIAGRLQRLMDRGVLRVAMVAESKTATRMAKTFAVLARALGSDIEVFTQLHAAEAWLHDARGITDTEETPLPS